MYIFPWLTASISWPQVTAPWRTTRAMKSKRLQLPSRRNAKSMWKKSAPYGEKSAAGKTAQVRALLMKYDAGRLSGVKPEDYAALLAEAEVL